MVDNEIALFITLLILITKQVSNHNEHVLVWRHLETSDSSNSQSPYFLQKDY